MAYEPKPGQLSLFKNDRKNKDSHPDYAGDGLDLDGNPVWINAWIKEGKNGKFFSISLKRKDGASVSQRGGGGSDRPSEDPLAGRRDLRDDPFADDFVPFLIP